MKGFKESDKDVVVKRKLSCEGMDANINDSSDQPKLAMPSRIDLSKMTKSYQMKEEIVQKQRSS